MRIATSAPPTWPPPLAHPGPLHPVRLGQVVEVAGAAVSAARTGQGFASGAYGFDTTGQALSTTGSLVSTTAAMAGVGMMLMGTAPIPVVGWVAAAVGALLTIAGMFMGGKPKLSHAQREALEVQRVAGTVGGMFQEIQAAPSLDALWTVLKRWQSGYVGGTSSVAVPIYFRAPGGDVGDATAEAAMKETMLALVASGGIILPFDITPDKILATYTNYTGAMGATWPGNQNQWYPVFTKQGFYSLFEQHPEWIRANTQAGVTRSMLDPINTNVRNAILNAMQRLGYRFTPGGGAALLFGSAAAATTPTGADPAMVTNWVGQAYQQLLGRTPSSAERAEAVAVLTAQQITPQQFLTRLTTSAEFALAHGTTVAVTPTGTVITGVAPTGTGQPLSTYWWQNALLAPSQLQPIRPFLPAGAQPVVMASMLPTGGGSGTAWLLGLGALGLMGFLLFSGPTTARRRR